MRTVDRFSGAVAAAALSSGYDGVAQVLVDVVGITQITSHRKEGT